MSLLLDARKKSQAALGGDSSRSGFGYSLEEHPNTANPSTVTSPTAPPNNATSSGPSSENSARVTGQNLFNAKSSSTYAAFAGINRNLLYALGGTVILLAAGGGYVWYITSDDSSQAMRPVVRAPAATPPAPQTAPQTAAIAEATPKAASTPEAAPAKPAGIKQPPRIARPKARVPSLQSGSKAPVQIVQQQESIDPLLNSAYQAYREGKFDQAQQLYREALKLDGRNTDALLGLAAIAQRRGADGVATHYYAKVLELNPRDAVANAGMSALTTNDNIESRLKYLLNEQQDSSPLHFALGNFYASQERWGEAQQAYFNAYKLEPKSAVLAFHLAISHERLGQKKLAALYYQSALQLDASHSDGFDHAIISQRIAELTR